MSATDIHQSATGEDLSGRRLVGRYQVLERIGQGGMAAVYRACDEQLKRDVALKVFHRGLDSPRDLERQHSEMQHLSELTHPCLVTLHDAISDTQGQSFLVLEYVPGPDLRTRLADGPMPASQVAAIGRDVADALAHIHEHNVIHRDVSPGNILLPNRSPNGHGVAAKLSDLGIARMAGTEQVTETGTLIGTAAYLSPEQVRGHQLSGASDIYSLGLVLLECLTGRRAFSGPAVESAMARLNRDPSIPSEMAASWRDLISSMTAREPTQRPTAAETAAALAAAVTTGGCPTTVLRTMPLEVGDLRRQKNPFTRKMLWIVGGGVALVIALALLMAIPAGSQATKPTPPQYPLVPGQLGAHLKQLEHDVSP